MKVNVLFLILIGAVLFLQSCAPSQVTKMAAVVSSDQKIGYEETIISQKKHFVSLAPYNELNVQKDKTMFMLGVQNFGDTPFDVGYGNITVRFQDAAMSLPSERISVESYDRFALAVRKEQSAKVKKYIKDELDDVIIKLDTSSSSYSSSSSSSSSSDSSSDSSSSSDDSTGDTVETMLEDLEMDIETMRANNQLLREALPEIIMKTQTTIMPGGSYSAVVVCDTDKLDEELEGRFQVAVLVGGEEHIFTFNRELNQ